MRRIFCATAAVIVALNLASRALQAAPHPRLPASLKRAIDAYESTSEALRRGTQRRTMQPLFTAARLLKRALLQQGGSDILIEELTGKQFDDVVARARGMIVNREEVLIVEPDPRHFLSLARKTGLPEDVAFFEQLTASRPEGVWPSYVWQETDVSGCTVFGNGELTARYAGWVGFTKRYPKAYEQETRLRLREIEWHLVESRCACTDAGAVVAELERFLRTFPRAAVAVKVRKRLEVVRNGQSDIMFACGPDKVP